MDLRKRTEIRSRLVLQSNVAPPAEPAAIYVFGWIVLWTILMHREKAHSSSDRNGFEVVNEQTISQYGGRKLPRRFFQRGAEAVGQELVGAMLVRRINGTLRTALITETEAYIGTHDLACHASRGRTPRTEIMFGPAGYAYVYLIYGMYYMLNIVTSAEGDAQAVLLRGAQPMDHWKMNLSGPGKLARAFHITKADHGLDMTGDDLYIMKNPKCRLNIEATKRIGIDYAGKWKHALLRFVGTTSH